MMLYTVVRSEVKWSPSKPIRILIIQRIHWVLKTEGSCTPATGLARSFLWLPQAIQICTYSSRTLYTATLQRLLQWRVRYRSVSSTPSRFPPFLSADLFLSILLPRPCRPSSSFLQAGSNSRRRFQLFSTLYTHATLPVIYAMPSISDNRRPSSEERRKRAERSSRIPFRRAVCGESRRNSRPVVPDRK